MNRQILGMLSVAAGVSVFSVQDVIVKFLSATYPVHQIVVVRSVVALPILLAVTLIEDGGKFRMHRLGLHALRGLVLYASYTAYYLALASLTLANTVALTFTVPFFVPILGERVAARSWVAIGVGFLAVLLIVRPDAGLVEPASLLPIASALAYAVSALLARRLGTTEGGGAMAFSATVIYGVAGAVTALTLAGIESEANAHASIRFLFNPWVWPGALDLSLLALCGLIAAFGFFFLGQGYRLAKANIAAPFEYVALPWSVLWGYLFFGSIPDATMIVGASAIAGAGFYTLQQGKSRLAK